MYQIVYQETALSDMRDIISYIAHDLENPTVAERLMSQMLEAADSLSDFPYKYQVYIPIRPLEYEYRIVRAGNYNLFYRIDEADKTVIISRVIYSARNTARIMHKLQQLF